MVKHSKQNEMQPLIIVSSSHRSPRTVTDFAGDGCLKLATGLPRLGAQVAWSWCAALVQSSVNRLRLVILMAEFRSDTYPNSSYILGRFLIPNSAGHY